MDVSGKIFDWNRARAFLAAANEGSLSAAARALGVAQPTLGRQVAALEDELGVKLFDREARGLKLTPSGLELAEHVRAMGDAANKVALTASGQSHALAGVVRITSTDVASAFILPPILAQLRLDEPGIEIELVATNAMRDLRSREADIAVRSVRPTDPELIARKVCTHEARLYAADTYIERNGGFRTTEDLNRATYIGFDQNDEFLMALNGLGLSLSALNTPVRCGAHLVQWQLVQAGMGIGVMTTDVGEATQGVQAVGTWLPPFPFEIWLVAHQDLRTSRKMRLVFDRLAEALARP